MALRDEETDDRTDVEHVDQDTKFIGVSMLREILAPEDDLLRSIDEHAVPSFSFKSSHLDLLVSYPS